MKTIQMTIDEPFLAEVDQMIQTLNTTRSAFVRQALELALQRHA
jgi:metal-responsive CopG/Arc/MetJ family transcriptional regulator